MQSVAVHHSLHIQGDLGKALAVIFEEDLILCKHLSRQLERAVVADVHLLGERALAEDGLTLAVEMLVQCAAALGKDSGIR